MFKNTIILICCIFLLSSCLWEVNDNEINTIWISSWKVDNTWVKPKGINDNEIKSTWISSDEIGDIWIESEKVNGQWDCVNMVNSQCMDVLFEGQ